MVLDTQEAESLGHVHVRSVDASEEAVRRSHAPVAASFEKPDKSYVY
jgi:hypothetical protein